MNHALFVSLVSFSLAACAAEGGRRPSPGTGVDAGSSTPMDSGTVTRRDSQVPPADVTCEQLDIAASPDTANVLIVLDASGSMYDFFGGVDRWTPSVAAIGEVTRSLDDRLQFGLMVFPGRADECGAGDVSVAVGPARASAIAGELAGDPFLHTGGGTPIADTLDAAVAALSGLEGDSYVLLVTDGAPNCNEGLDDFSCRCTAPGPLGCLDAPYNCLDDTRAVAAVGRLAAAGIGTYVIGYDTSEWASVMNAMASAGDTGHTTHFAVGDGASLELALRDIGSSVVSCTYELASPPGDVHYVRVTVDGETVDHEMVAGSGEGWRLDGDRTVELQGAACANVRDGNPHDIRIAVECEPVII